MGSDGWRNQWGESLQAGQSRLRQAAHCSTYCIVFVHVVSLVKEGLLGVHLLEVAVWVSVHLDAVWGGWNALVWAIQLLLRLGEDGGAGLAVLCHAVVVEAVVGLRHAMAHVLRVLRAGAAIMMVLREAVERAGEVGEGRGSALSVVAVAVEVTQVRGETVSQIQVKVEIDQVAKLMVVGRVHSIIVGVGPRVRAVHRESQRGPRPGV